MTATQAASTERLPAVSALGRVADALGRLKSWLAATGRHGVWIAVWSLIGWGGTLLAPFMTDQPFLVMLMAPRALFVALAADSVDLATFVLAGTIRLGITDASYFIIGRRFPRSGRRPRSSFRLLVRWADAACRWLCDHGLKAATVLFFRPNGKYLAVAGSYGVSAQVAGWASVAGTAVYLASFHLGLELLGF